jgi:hypothetical protein
MLWTSWTNYDHDWNLVFRVGGYAAVFTLKNRRQPRLRFYWPAKHQLILAEIKDRLRAAIDARTRY